MNQKEIHFEIEIKLEKPNKDGYAKDIVNDIITHSTSNRELK